METEKLKALLKALEETIDINLPLTDSQRVDLVRTFIGNMKVRIEMDEKNGMSYKLYLN